MKNQVCALYVVSGAYSLKQIKIFSTEKLKREFITEWIKTQYRTPFSQRVFSETEDFIARFIVSQDFSRTLIDIEIPLTVDDMSITPQHEKE